MKTRLNPHFILKAESEQMIEGKVQKVIIQVRFDLTEEQYQKCLKWKEGGSDGKEE